MYKILRIIFTLLSVACAALCCFIGILFGFEYALLLAGASAIFFMLMIFFKRKQEIPLAEEKAEDLFLRQCELDKKDEKKED